jgi:hypothetical protein
MGPITAKETESVCAGSPCVEKHTQDKTSRPASIVPLDSKQKRCESSLGGLLNHYFVDWAAKVGRFLSVPATGELCQKSVHCRFLAFWPETLVKTQKIQTKFHQMTLHLTQFLPCFNTDEF